MRYLGRRKPSEFDHVRKHQLRLASAVDRVEKVLHLPYYHWSHDQGAEGACVGFALSMMMAIQNEMQARKTFQKPFVHSYNARWLWEEAKKIDEWDDTNPGDSNGTSVKAGCDVLRTIGHQRKKRRVFQEAVISEGIKENQWAVSVDDVRTAISQGIPVTIGVYWYSNFDKPVSFGAGWKIGEGDLGYIRGGHAICLYGASDKKQAFKLKNSWGRDYPLVWLPYKTLERLIREDGEVTLITDR